MMLNVLHDVTGTSCWCHALPDPMHNFHVVYALEKATGSYISFFFYSEVLGINNRFECVLSNSPWVSYSNNTHDRQIYIGKPVLKHVTVSMNKKAKKVYQKGFLKTVIKAGIIPRIVNSFQLRELGVQNTTAMYPWNVILSLLHQCILGLSLMSSKIHQLFFPALPKKLPIIFFNSHTVPIILILFFLYCCRLLLDIIETILASCHLKMKHIIIVLIIIIIIWDIFEINSLKFTKITYTV